MVHPRIEPADKVAFDDIEHALTGGGDGGSCWCLWWTRSRREFNAMSRSDKRRGLQDELRSTDPSPALVAFVDGEGAGWVRIGPRPAQPRLLNARAVRSGSPEPADDARVWAVSCLVVRREHRRQGLADHLVDAAVDHAGTHGARIVEAYPIDTSRRQASSNELYVGSVKLFSRRGFTEIARPFGARVVMSRALTGTDNPQHHGKA